MKRRFLAFLEAIYPLIIYQAITIFVTIFAFAFMMITGVVDLGNGQKALDDIQNILLNSNLVIIISAIGAGISLVILVLINALRKDNILNVKGSKKPEFVDNTYIILVFLLCLLLSLFSNGLINLPIVSNIVNMDTGFREANSILGNSSSIWTLFFVIIGAPIIEEYVFRRMCYGILRKYTTVLKAAIFSSLYFGLFHGNLVQGIYASILGFGLAYLYEVSDNVLVTIFAHMASNLLALVISGLYENNILYMGTSFGIIIYTLLMLILCIALVFYINKYRLVLKGDERNEIA